MFLQVAADSHVHPDHALSKQKKKRNSPLRGWQYMPFSVESILSYGIFPKSVGCSDGLQAPASGLSRNPVSLGLYFNRTKIPERAKDDSSLKNRRHPSGEVWRTQSSYNRRQFWMLLTCGETWLFSALSVFFFPWYRFMSPAFIPNLAFPAIHHLLLL